MSCIFDPIGAGLSSSAMLLAMSASLVPISFFGPGFSCQMKMKGREDK